MDPGSEEDLLPFALWKTKTHLLYVCRDAALGVKADVDGLLRGLDSVEGSISGLSDKLQESMDTIDDLNVNLTKVNHGKGRIINWTGLEWKQRDANTW